MGKEPPIPRTGSSPAIPIAPASDPRTLAAWRTWLAALAEDAEAALAAALTYEGLAAEGRTAWLDALETDAPEVRVPRVALYAPLLSVERDDERRARIVAAMSEGALEGALETMFRPAPRAFAGSGSLLLVWPLYLDFVELLVCRYGADGISEARHEPLVHQRDVPDACARAGVGSEQADLEEAIEDLAHAVVADRRAGRAPHAAVVRFSRLFDAQLR